MLIQRKKKYAVLIASITILVVYIVLGMITAIVPNPFFIRMMPVRWFDQVFLLTTAILSGIFFGMYYYAKQTTSVCSFSATGGILAGIFSFGCAICNHLLIFVFGISGVLTYFAPLQPILGVISIIVLIFAISKQYDNINKYRYEH